VAQLERLEPISDIADETTADLRKLQESAQERADYAWRQLRKYGWLDDGFLWLSGLTAGAAGISAVLEAPSALTAVAAFASAVSTAVTKPVRSKREHAVSTAADYRDIAWRADQAAKNDPDRTARLNSLIALHERWHKLERSPAP
jgi:hypothetical protein